MWFSLPHNQNWALHVLVAVFAHTFNESPEIQKRKPQFITLFKHKLGTKKARAEWSENVSFIICLIGKHNSEIYSALLLFCCSLPLHNSIVVATQN